MWWYYESLSRERIDNLWALSYRFRMDNLLMTSKLLRGSRGILVLLAFSLLSAACSDTTAPLFTTWEGMLQPVRPNTLGGRGAAVTQFGHTVASVQIEEGEPEVSYGWRIDSGSCQEAGDTQGGPAAYRPLVTTEGGSASAEATLSQLFETGDLYAMKVFLPTGDGGEEIVACGELVQIQ
jgi:hypothetical protein